ncbi:MAG: hypothetical protein JWQ81_5917 [Amycolatopsis sp.]|uniref:hypothetical protein n=1 Tax=Amycolatopsis sp. TaxID=37632 RepID=UPI00262042AA|nr:hypothetical protein [Amycolatopsis sp.]MCU1685178.1 hypothetical protein [Amycolatopsis sp.]
MEAAEVAVVSSAPELWSGAVLLDSVFFGVSPVEGSGADVLPAPRAAVVAASWGLGLYAAAEYDQLVESAR